MLELSIDEARKLVLLSQWLPWVKPRGRALEATLAAVQHLGYIQIDTISVIERAHHHTLWNRTSRYQSAHLEQLLQQKKIFEYWSHAAAYLPMENYRFSLPRMRAFADGERHWFTPDPKMMKHVLARITAEGALRTQDFADTRAGKAGMWEWKPAKQALAQLFMQGELMTLRRQGFQKVYDLSERVLPPDVDTRMPSQAEYARFLVERFLRANGLGQAAEVTYQRSGVKAIVERCMKKMTRDGEIVPVLVKGGAAKQQIYHALPHSLELLQQSLSRKRLKILSPFDNLVIQRNRMQQLFDFDYRIECYTPASKRKFGYFVLPILWDGRLLARMDCKADRKNNRLVIRNFVSEAGLDKKDGMKARLVDALVGTLGDFAVFNGCDEVVVEKLQDKVVQRLLKESL